MHPFPSRSELCFLLGEEFSQLVFNPYSLRFGFLSEQWIVAVNVEYVDAQGRVERHEMESKAQPSSLHRVLRHSIAVLEVESFILSFTLDDGSILRIFSDDGPYECGQISSPDGLIVY